MSLWNRFRRALGLLPTTGDIAVDGDRVVLRDLARARDFPQEPSEPGQPEIDACGACQRRPLRKVVFTTAGSGAQEAIWRAYPLAVDGWVCTACGWAAMPRRITVEESVAFARAAALHATAGRFDDAEFWWRRILASWPGYPAAYADLGQLALARRDATEDPDAKTSFLAEALAWLRRAAAADPERQLGPAHVRLATTLALSGDEDEALALFDALTADARLSKETRDEAADGGRQVREGRALFSRAAALVGASILEPARAPLAPHVRRRLDTAQQLLQEALARAESFATAFFLGKVEIRLGRVESGARRLELAHRLDPEQPDGCRELAAVYLELARHDEALQVSERAVELRPGDAGLCCNLALAQLLCGKPKRASSTVARALELDPHDAITRSMARVIEEVRSGLRERPRSLAELEGR